MAPMAPEKRSKAMSRIKGKDTAIEIALRKALWHRGHRYRKNDKSLPGTPDIVLRKYKIAIFCDSEFFHGYDWEHKKQRLGENKEYWIKKIERNMARDKAVDKALLDMGWAVIHFWGNEILKHADECVAAIEDLIFEINTGLPASIFDACTEAH